MKTNRYQELVITLPVFIILLFVLVSCEKEEFLVDMNTNYLWVAGDNTLIYSNDAGANWTDIIKKNAINLFYDPEPRFRSVNFYNTSFGYLTGKSMVSFYYTTDNAYQWDEGPVNNIVGNLVKVNVNGFTTPDNRNIYYITDNIFVKESSRYSKDNLGPILNESETETIRFYNTALKSMIFPNTAQGWILGDSTVQNSSVVIPVILSTLDSAKTWTKRVFTTPATIRAISTAPSSLGFCKWAVGDNGTILKSNYLDAEWVIVGSGVTDSLNSIYFQSPELGFITGSNGVLLRTTNAGSNWLKLNTSTNQTLTCVSFANDSTGVVVGKRGTILKTTDSGDTWQPVDFDVTNDLYGVTFCKRRVFTKVE